MQINLVFHNSAILFVNIFYLAVQNKMFSRKNDVIDCFLFLKFPFRFLFSRVGNVCGWCVGWVTGFRQKKKRKGWCYVFPVQRVNETMCLRKTKRFHAYVFCVFFFFFVFFCCCAVVCFPLSINSSRLMLRLGCWFAVFACVLSSKRAQKWEWLLL